MTCYITGSKIIELRLLTRFYKQRQTQVKNEIHNLLQRANIKLTSYLSAIFSKNRRIKASPEELVEAMNGKLSLENRLLLVQSLEECQLYRELI